MSDGRWQRRPASAPPPVPPSTVIPDTTHAPVSGRQPVTLAMVLGYRYYSSAVAGAPRDGVVVPQDFLPTAEPGSRAPHMWLDRSGARLSTLDLYERTPVLLSGPDGGAWHAAGLRAAGQGVPLACYRVGRGAEYDLTPEDGSDWAQLHGTGLRRCRPCPPGRLRGMAGADVRRRPGTDPDRCA